MGIILLTTQSRVWQGININVKFLRPAAARHSVNYAWPSGPSPGWSWSPHTVAEQTWAIFWHIQSFHHFYRRLFLLEEDRDQINTEKFFFLCLLFFSSFVIIIFKTVPLASSVFKPTSLFYKDSLLDQTWLRFISAQLCSVLERILLCHPCSL